MLQRLSGDSLPASCPFTFGDVPSTHKFLRHICWLSQADITSAGSGDNFAPDRNTTRGEMAIFLYRLNYWRFSDVGMVDNGYEAVAWMQREGITTIPEGGKFGGENSIKKEALAAFLYRAAGKPAFTPPANSPFPDLEPGDDFYKEITWAHSRGIFKGTSEGMFDPEGTLTRASVALVLRRYTGQAAIDNCPITFDDVKASTDQASSICWLAVKKITTVAAGGNFNPTKTATRLDVAKWLYRMNQKSLL